MYLRVADGQVTGVEPRDFPHNRGSLCPKGVVAYQQVNHPERLLFPMMRRGGKDSPLVRVSWDEALDYVARRWKAIQAQFGRDAVAVYSGSSMTNEKCYLMGKFARVGLGTRHVDYNGRLCMSSAAVAYAKAFGVDRAPLPMTDIPLTQCLLVVGSNVAETFPVATQWLWQARDNGASLIVLDPRETATARTADLWLPVRPGTDIAVLNAMLRQIIHDGLVDEAYIAQRTVGWEKVRATVEAYTPEVAERVAGVPAARIVAAARLYGRAERSLILHARGVEHSTHGVDTCLACINLALARGQVGKPGGGTMMLTGQGNGQGGREVGQKANQLPGYRHIDDPEDRAYIAGVWGVPVEEVPWEGAAATEMIGLMLAGQIKSCLVICSNLMVSLPENEVVKRALLSLDPLVVIDFFLSETAELADVVLPGSVWCEDEGTTTNLEGRVVKINWAANPPGEARRDIDIICDLARRLGRGRFFPYRSARDVWEELRVASKGGRGRLLRHHLGEDRGAGRRVLALPHGGPPGHAPPVCRALRTSRRQGPLLRRRVYPTRRGAGRRFPLPTHDGTGSLPLTVKIPEYKVCAARVERADVEPAPITQGPTVHLTPAANPRMFPYVTGESRTPVEEEGKAY
jgi:assimilatory nitrate reductase catalytic subunit